MGIRRHDQTETTAKAKDGGRENMSNTKENCRETKLKAKEIMGSKDEAMDGGIANRN